MLLSSDSAAEEPSSEAISMVTHTFYFLLLLEHICPRVLCDLPPSAKLARLMCVFLIGRCNGGRINASYVFLQPPMWKAHRCSFHADLNFKSTELLLLVSIIVMALMVLMSPSNHVKRSSLVFLFPKPVITVRLIREV